MLVFLEGSNDEVNERAVGTKEPEPSPEYESPALNEANKENPREKVQDKSLGSTPASLELNSSITPGKGKTQITKGRHT